MISFTSLIVLATAGFSAVSGIAIPKRDLPSDISILSGLVETLDSDVKAIDPQQDPSVTTLLITGDIYNLSSALLTAAINENNVSISDDQIPSFKNLLADFKALVADIDAQVPTIQAIPGLAEEMANGLIATDGFAIAYITTVASDISEEHLDDVVQILGLIEDGFDNITYQLVPDTQTTSNGTSSSS